MRRQAFTIENINVELLPVEEDYVSQVYKNNLQLEGDPTLYEDVIQRWTNKAISATIYADGERAGVLCADIAKPLDVLGLVTGSDIAKSITDCSPLLQRLSKENGLYINIAYLEPQYRGLGIMSHIIFEKFELGDLGIGVFPYIFCVTHDEPYEKFWAKNRFHDHGHIHYNREDGQYDIVAINPIWMKS